MAGDGLAVTKTESGLANLGGTFNTSRGLNIPCYLVIHTDISHARIMLRVLHSLFRVEFHYRTSYPARNIK